MEDKIAYRAWHKTREYMYYDVAIEVEGQVGYRMNAGTFSYEAVECVVICQSTGYKDKTDVTIFGGDILKIAAESEPLLVGWDLNHENFVLKSPHDKKTKPFGTWRSKRSVKVLGNIHEDPELLALD